MKKSKREIFLEIKNAQLEILSSRMEIKVNNVGDITNSCRDIKYDFGDNSFVLEIIILF